MRGSGLRVPRDRAIRLADRIRLAGAIRLAERVRLAKRIRLRFTVVSTLLGLTDVPHRIRWVATPSGPVGDVKEVDFLIDDQLTGVEHLAPYSFGEDAGWLVTSFLVPGKHTFTTKAVALDDGTAVETVTAVVKAAPQPPAELAGRWSRSVAGGDAAGVWHVTINPTGWLFDDPNGGGQNQDASYPARARS